MSKSRFMQFLDVFEEFCRQESDEYLPRDRFVFSSHKSREDEEFVNSDDDEVQDEDSWTTRHHSRACGSYSRRSSSSCCGGGGDDEDDSYQERMVNDAVTCARLGRIMRIVDRANDIAARRR